MNLRKFRLPGSTVLLLLSGSTLGLGQGILAPEAPPPAAPPQNPVCTRLEGQLTAFDRGIVDPARADQIRRYEDAVNQQQSELDRTVAQARRIGCRGSGFFSLFSGQPAQCGGLNNKIQQMRGNLDRMMSDLQRLQSSGGDRQEQRQAIIGALAQNDCGPQYRAALNNQPRGFFSSLFGSPGGTIETPPDSQSSTFRTLCVRSCDGFYFPISFATTPAHFNEDAQMCQRLCPAAEVSLYTYRNPGEDVSQAVSISGQPYTALPNAFRYRQVFNPSCSCRRPGQSWAQALGQTPDDTIERGDIIVTDERAKALSRPKGVPAKSTPQSKATGPAPNASPNSDQPNTASGTNGKPKVRTVGPTFLPGR